MDYGASPPEDLLAKLRLEMKQKLGGDEYLYNLAIGTARDWLCLAANIFYQKALQFRHEVSAASIAAEYGNLCAGAHQGELREYWWSQSRSSVVSHL